MRAGCSTKFREEVKLTKGRVLVRGQIATRIQNPEVLGGPRRADFILYGLPNLPLAGLEAKRKKRERTFILEQNGF